MASRQIIVRPDAEQTIAELAGPQVEIAAEALKIAIPDQVPVRSGTAQRLYRESLRVEVGEEGSARVTGLPFLWHWLRCPSSGRDTTLRRARSSRRRVRSVSGGSRADVDPRLPQPNLRDRRDRDAVFGRERLQGFSCARAYLPHLSLRQRRLRMALAVGGTSLSRHVRVVVGRRSQEQMLGIDARWNVATVADEHPVGDRVVVKLPRDALRMAILASVPDHAVAVLRARTTPQPAAARDNLVSIVEALSERRGFVLHQRIAVLVETVEVGRAKSSCGVRTITTVHRAAAVGRCGSWRCSAAERIAVSPPAPIVSLAPRALDGASVAVSDAAGRAAMPRSAFAFPEVTLLDALTFLGWGRGRGRVSVARPAHSTAAAA
jgi:hypothetical protein